MTSSAVQTLDKYVTDLRTDRDQLKSEFDQLKNQDRSTASLSAPNGQLTATLEEARREYTELSKINIALTETIQLQEKQLHDSQEVIVKLQDELETHRKEFQANRLLDSAIEKERDSIRNERDALADSLERSKSDNNKLKTKMRALLAERDDLLLRSDAVAAEFEEANERIKVEYERALEAKDKEMEATLAARAQKFNSIIANSEDELDALVVKHEKEITKLNENHAAVENRLLAEFEKVKNKYGDSTGEKPGGPSVISDHTSTFLKQHEEIIESLHARNLTMKQQYEAKIAALNEQLEEKLANLTSHYGAKVTALEEHHVVITQQHEAELRRYEQQTEMLKTQHEGELRILRMQQDSKIFALTSQLKALVANHQEEITSQGQQQAAEIKAVRVQCENDIKSARKQMEAELSQNIQSSEAKLKAAQQQFEHDISMLKAMSEAEAASLTQQHEVVVATLTAQQEALTNRRDVLMSKYTSCLESRDKLLTEKNQFEETIHALNIEVSSFKTLVDDMKSRNDELNQKIEEVQEALCCALSDRYASDKQKDGIIIELTKQIENISVVVEENEIDKQSSAKQLLILAESRDNLRLDKDSLEKLTDQLKVELSKLSDDYTKLVADFPALAEQREKLERERDALSLHRTQLMKELDIVCKQLEAIKEEYSDVTLQNESLSAKVASVSVNRDELLAMKQQNENKIVTLTIEVTKLSEIVDSSNNKLETQAAYIVDLESEVAALRKNVIDQTEFRNSAEITVTSTKEDCAGKIAILSGEIDQLTLELDAATNEVEDLKVQLRSMQGKLEESEVLKEEYLLQRNEACADLLKSNTLLQQTKAEKTFAEEGYLKCIQEKDIALKLRDEMAERERLSSQKAGKMVDEYESLLALARSMSLEDMQRVEGLHEVEINALKADFEHRLLEEESKYNIDTTALSDKLKAMENSRLALQDDFNALNAEHELLLQVREDLDQKLADATEEFTVKLMALSTTNDELLKANEVISQQLAETSEKLAKRDRSNAQRLKAQEQREQERSAILQKFNKPIITAEDSTSGSKTPDVKNPKVSSKDVINNTASPLGASDSSELVPSSSHCEPKIATPSDNAEVPITHAVLEAQVTSLTENLGKKAVIIRDLTKANSKLTKDLEDRDVEIENIKADMRKQEDIWEQRLPNYANIIAGSDAKDETIAENFSRIAALQSQLIELTKKADDTDALLKASLQDIDRLNSRISELQDTIAAREADFEAKITEIRKSEEDSKAQQLMALQDKLVSEEVAVLTQDITSYKLLNEALESEKRSLSASIRALELKVGALQAEKEELNGITEDLSGMGDIYCRMTLVLFLWFL